MVEANASPQSRVRPKEIVQIARSPQEYLSELEETNPVSDAKMVSRTDPDAVWPKKVGPAKMAYFDNYLIDTRQHSLANVLPGMGFPEGNNIRVTGRVKERSSRTRLSLLRRIAELAENGDETPPRDLRW
jgi:hypothetical protein